MFLVFSEKWPITSSRGVTWDMVQFHQLFSSNRTPHRPNDSMDRFFKTKTEGVAPHHVIVNCNGVLWKVDILNSNNEIKSADELYAILKFIESNSIDQKKYSVTKLTTTDRDTWAQNRDELLRVSARNLENLHDIETSILFLTLAPGKAGDQSSFMKTVLLDESWMTWQDKSVSLVIYQDGQVATQGDHSNIDAIVLLQVGDYVAERVRKELWHPCKLETFQTPLRLDFELSEHLRNELSLADVSFYKNKRLYRARPIHYSTYGNDLCRTAKVYTDTVIQIALQLAYVRTHGMFAPIYETASTRKFYHGRTETVRGCTPEFVRFARLILGEEKEETTSAKVLFEEAILAHNKLMADCMDGNGFDRHLLGLKKTLEIMNKGCGPKWAVPEFLQNETWRRLGGNGNFLLSTSFIGYMTGNQVGTIGYVAAMRADGYGCFYRIGKDRISVAVSDWAGTRSNIDAFSGNVVWALDRLQEFMSGKSKM
ncbi:unnamed protein product [Caenorhabditis angaria]|uniref:Choline/carnitine acyltransferase domain-containing protein n=1 Tax=Caenorhabditis angaria TaxID=860376 RepID=A0A9P1IY50_9PELO|nr:unnamed protein product [Caenorhabditis angaria]